jgi:hypothetical protein
MQDGPAAFVDIEHHLVHVNDGTPCGHGHDKAVCRQGGGMVREQLHVDVSDAVFDLHRIVEAPMVLVFADEIGRTTPAWCLCGKDPRDHKPDELATCFRNWGVRAPS